MSHSLFARDLFCTLSRGLVFISNANPACSCVYICKFQFRPIHPPSRRLSVAAVEGHELKTPETEHRPGQERLLETAHLELDGKLFVKHAAGPYLARQLSAFRDRGVPEPTSEVSPRALAQMGRREAEREGGKRGGRRRA